MNETERARNRHRLLTCAAENPQTGCWDWRGQVSNSGYGRVKLGTADGNRMDSAHRASYLVFVGVIPDGMYVRQTCGNRLCINPDHLELLREGELPSRPLRSSGM